MPLSVWSGRLEAALAAHPYQAGFLAEYAGRPEGEIKRAVAADAAADPIRGASWHGFFKKAVGLGDGMPPVPAPAKLPVPRATAPLPQMAPSRPAAGPPAPARAVNGLPLAGQADERAHFAEIARQRGYQPTAYRGLQVGDVGPDRRRFLGTQNQRGWFGGTSQAPVFDAPIPQDLAAQGKFVNDQPWRRVTPQGMTPPQQQAFRRVALSDQQQAALRTSQTTGWPGAIQQMTGATPANVVAGQALESQMAGRAGQDTLRGNRARAMADLVAQGHDPAAPETAQRAEQAAAQQMAAPAVQARIQQFGQQANPMSPIHDTAGAAAGRYVRGLPRMMAGFGAFAPATAVDVARAATGQGADFRHMRGAAIDFATPLTSGAMVDPYGRAGNESLFGQIMPRYAAQTQTMARDPNSATNRVMGATLSPLAQNAELLSGLRGASGLSGVNRMPLLQPGNLGSAARLAYHGAGAVVGPMMAGYTGANAAIGELTGAGPAGAQAATAEAGRADAGRLTGNPDDQRPPIVPRPGEDVTDPGMSPRLSAEVDARNQADRQALGRIVAQSPAAPANTPAPSGPQPPAPAKAPAPSPQEAQARVQQAHQGIATLGTRIQGGLDPQAAHAEAAQHLDDLVANQAALTGRAPEEVRALAGKLMADGRLDAQDWAQLSRSPDLAERAQQMGTDAWSAFQAMPTPQKIALGAGIPMALYGVLSGLFGEGGVGSLLMTVLGLGATAGGLGLFGGSGPLQGLGAQIPGMGKLQGGFQSLGDLLHWNDAPAAPPAQQPPAPAAAAGPNGAPTAQAPPGGVAAPSVDLGGMLADNVVDPHELQTALGSPAARQQLLSGASAQQDQFLRAALRGNPDLGSGLSQARMGMNVPAFLGGGRDAVLAKAQQRFPGITPAQFDALMASYGRVGG
jgi:hypothetical protein